MKTYTMKTMSLLVALLALAFAGCSRSESPGGKPTLVGSWIVPADKRQQEGLFDGAITTFEKDGTATRTVYRGSDAGKTFSGKWKVSGDKYIAEHKDANGKTVTNEFRIVALTETSFAYEYKYDPAVVSPGGPTSGVVNMMRVGKVGGGLTMDGAYKGSSSDTGDLVFQPNGLAYEPKDGKIPSTGFIWAWQISGNTLRMMNHRRETGGTIESHTPEALRTVNKHERLDFFKK